MKKKTYIWPKNMSTMLTCLGPFHLKLLVIVTWHGDTVCGIGVRRHRRWCLWSRLRSLLWHWWVLLTLSDQGSKKKKIGKVISSPPLTHHMTYQCCRTLQHRPQRSALIMITQLHTLSINAHHTEWTAGMFLFISFFKLYLTNQLFISF